MYKNRIFFVICFASLYTPSLIPSSAARAAFLFFLASQNNYIRMLNAPGIQATPNPLISPALTLPPVALNPTQLSVQQLTIHDGQRPSHISVGEVLVPIEIKRTQPAYTPEEMLGIIATDRSCKPLKKIITSTPHAAVPQSERK